MIAAMPGIKKGRRDDPAAPGRQLPAGRCCYLNMRSAFGGRKPSWNRSAAFGAFSRSEEHTSELQSLMRISYAVFCLKKKKLKQYMNSVQHNQSLHTIYPY